MKRDQVGRCQCVALLAFYLLSASAVFLAGCALQNTEPQPPEIVYGQDACDLCGMLIGEPKYAAALLLENDESAKFDDVGDMFVYHEQHPESPVRAWFVHDYQTEVWTRGERAFYVASTTVKSPMGHGLAAFADRDAAETFAAGLGAGVLTFDALLTGTPVAGH